MSNGNIYVAKQSFTVNLDGSPVAVKGGVTRVREGHRLLELAPDNFKLLDVHYDVEQATAGPGEKRGRKHAA